MSLREKRLQVYKSYLYHLYPRVVMGIVRIVSIPIPIGYCLSIPVFFDTFQ